VKKVPTDTAKIYFMTSNFHGRTMTMVSASDDPESHNLFGPYLPGIHLLPYNDTSVLDKALSDPHVAAVVVEPIQGEAGVEVPSPGYLRAVRDACARHNVLMVSDEVQTGLGRTGYMLATEHDDVRPDIVCLGKALSGGTLPASAGACVWERGRYCRQ
jgi:ornithine--oxo-acid transaminase